MTKSLSLSLAAALWLTPAPALLAQPTTDAAVTEAVRRQYETLQLRTKIVAAQEAQKRKDLPLASKLYEEAYALAQSVGQGVDAEMATLIAGMTEVRLALASAAQKQGDYRAADVQVTRLLKVAPGNPQALAFKRGNDKLLAESKGLMPSADLLDQRAKWDAERTANSQRVQDAKLLFENGRYAEAEVILAQVLADEPDNRAAAYYSSLIKERKYAEAITRRSLQTKQSIVEVEEAWQDKSSKLPAPNPYATNNLTHTSPHRQAIQQKLQRIRLDQIYYDGLPLSEVVRSLSEESRRRDPDKRGINFILAPAADTSAVAPTPAGGFNAGGPGGINPGFNPGFTTIDPNTGLPLTTGPAVTEEPVDMGSISIKLYTPVQDLTLQDALDIIVKVADQPIKYSIENYGIIISLRSRDPIPLHTRTFRVDPNTFWMGLERVGAIAFGDVETSSGGGGGRGGGGRGGGGRGGGQGGAEDSTLTVPRVSVAGSAGGSQGGGRGGGGSGSGGGSLFGGAPSLGSGAVGGGPGGLGLGGGGGGGQQGQGGEGLAFITSPQGVVVIQEAVRSFFVSLGIDMTPPKAVFFNDRQGTLFVRATLQDLDIIEQAVQVLNIAPPQVNIRAKFAEVGQKDTKALGFDWYLGNVLMNGGSIGYQGGTAPSFVGQPSAANPSGVFPGPGSGGPGSIGPGAIPPGASDGIVTPGLRNSANAPALFTLTGILTDPQFRMVVRALEQREGVELLSAPDVTTLSGRQAQLQVVEIRTIVTGNDISQTSSGGGGDTGIVGGGGGQGAIGSQLGYTTQPLPFGPVLDVIPYVSADGFTVQMVIIPTITEFVGYDDPGQFIPQVQSVGGNVGLPLTAQLPLPRFRVRQVTTTAVIWDGQTIALGGLISENVAKYKDKVPVLGDLPIVGKFFRSSANVTEKKNLVIFVTPTIIDPAGNRVHTEANLPFAQTGLPPQRPVTGPAAN